MITENLQNIKKNLPNDVTLIAVSKTKPNEEILEAYQAGHRAFGENRAQELTAKYEALPKDIEWHMIGHMQSNKVKYIAPFVHLIHSVHKFKLLKEVNKQGKRNDRVIDILLQFHIAEEDTKSGFTMDDAKQMLENKAFSNYQHINILGVMGMATFTNEMEKVRKEFQTLKRYFDELKENYFKEKEDFTVVSMGMSGDYEIAIEEGSNMVRVGSKIFGERNY